MRGSGRGRRKRRWGEKGRRFQLRLGHALLWPGTDSSWMIFLSLILRMKLIFLMGSVHLADWFCEDVSSGFLFWPLFCGLSGGAEWCSSFGTALSGRYFTFTVQLYHEFQRWFRDEWILHLALIFVFYLWFCISRRYFLLFLFIRHFIVCRLTTILSLWSRSFYTFLFRVLMV